MAEDWGLEWLDGLIAKLRKDGPLSPAGELTVRSLDRRRQSLQKKRPE